MGFGLVLVGGLVLVAAGVDRHRRGDRLLGDTGMVSGVGVTVTALWAIVRWSSLFDIPQLCPGFRLWMQMALPSGSQTNAMWQTGVSKGSM